MERTHPILVKLILALFFICAIYSPTGNKKNEDLFLQEKKSHIQLYPIKIPIVDIKQQECLAQNIYFEARGESKQGQIAIARVVMNRIKAGFGKTPCSVVNQSNYVKTITPEGEVEKVKVCQFSWVCDSQSIPNKNSPLYRQALTIAHDVLAYDAHTDILPGNALFFHSIIVNPGWNLHRVAKIGNHIFYSKGKQ